MDRTVGIYDLTKLVDAGQWHGAAAGDLAAGATEKLSGTVLKGKQLFYDARDTRLARDGYMSCASCHNDGGADGRTWDITGFGEGLRNTIALCEGGWRRAACTGAGTSTRSRISRDRSARLAVAQA